MVFIFDQSQFLRSSMKQVATMMVVAMSHDSNILTKTYITYTTSSNRRPNDLYYISIRGVQKIIVGTVLSHHLCYW